MHNDILQNSPVTGVSKGIFKSKRHRSLRALNKPSRAKQPWIHTHLLTTKQIQEKAN